MSDKSKREQARDKARFYFPGVLDPTPLVDLIIDAAKEELREEMDSLDEEILREMHRRHGKPPAGDGDRD